MTWVCAGANCDQPLRRANVRAADAPGTLAVTADGLCKRCYNQRIFKETVYLTPEQLQQVRQALDGWMTARRKRLRSKGASQWQQTKTVSTMRMSAPEQRRSGTAKPTGMPGAVVRRGGTTQGTRSRPARIARNTDFERSALELQM